MIYLFFVFKSSYKSTSFVPNCLQRSRSRTTSTICPSQSSISIRVGYNLFDEFEFSLSVNQIIDQFKNSIQGGKSSVTFSPDTGAVIKETKIQENPRKVREMC